MVSDGLVILWAVATGVVLFVGLARALDAPPPRRRRPVPGLVAQRVSARPAEGAEPSAPAESTPAAGERAPRPVPAIEQSHEADPRAAWGRAAARTIERERTGPDESRPGGRAEPLPADRRPASEACPAPEAPGDDGPEPRWRGTLPLPASTLHEGPATGPLAAHPATLTQPMVMPEPPLPAVQARATVVEREEPAPRVPGLPVRGGEPSPISAEPAGAAVERALVAAPPADAGIGIAAGAEPRGDAVEDAVLRCLALEESGRHEELVALASRRLLEAPLPAGSVVEAGEMSPVDRAALLTLLARGRAALGDAAGAEAARDACERIVVDPEEPATAPRMRRLGGRLGRRALDWAEAAVEGSEERLSVLDVALRWLDWNRRAGPEDGDAAALAAHAAEALVIARERRIAGLVAGRDFAQALGHLVTALSAGGVGEERRRALGELLWTGLTEEIDRLGSQALRERGGREAMGAMRGAERLARGAAARKLSRERRQELDGRIRRSYLALGACRLEAGDLPGSLEPLARALGGPPPRSALLRGRPAVLAPTVQSLVGRWSERIAGLARDGDRAAAMSEAGGLSRLIDVAFAHGLTADDLRAATEQRQALMLGLAGERAG